MDATKMGVMKYLSDVEGDIEGYELSKYFEKKNDTWVIKPYLLVYEFCGGTVCEMMNQKEDLEEMVSELVMMPNMSNRQKRYRMYLECIYWKYGYLGKGKRKVVHKCVRELILLKFPYVDGESLTGFKES